MEISKKIYMIAGGISILSLILIALIVILVRSLADDNISTTDPSITDPDEISLPYTNALIVKINNSTLWVRDIDSDNSMYLIKNRTTTFNSFDFHQKKNIYFGNTIAGQPIISYSKKFSDLTQPGIWYANEIAVDYVDEKVYVLDGLAEKINIFDIRNAYYNIISIDLYLPVDIAIDPIQRCLFILQKSSMLKTNMDGSLPEVIVRRNDIFTFEIDVNVKRIYSATRNAIESVDYAGKNLMVVEKINKAVISLAVSHNNLFWLNPSSDYEKSTLWLCKITNGTCSDTKSAIFDENAVQLKVYNFNRLQVSNPCDTMRNCQHMCVLSNNKPRCVCNVGWQLKSDSENCEAIDEYLLYVQGDFVKGRSLDFSKDTFTTALLPINLHVSFKTKSQMLGFDFDVRRRELIYTHDYSVNKINLKSGIIQDAIAGSFKDIKVYPAIDWITGNIYHIRSIYWDFFSLLVRNIEPYDNSIADYGILSITSSNTPKSLLVHPNRGLLFVLLHNIHVEVVEILRANMVGHEQKLFGRNFSISTMENGLALDYEEDRLFWFSADMKNIHSVDLEGSNLRSIDVSVVIKPTMINIYGNYIYVSNLTSIWRIDKKTDGHVLKVLPTFGYESDTIRGAKVFSKKSQMIKSNHPCALNNGGCQRYCIPKPKVKASSSRTNELEKLCKCNDNERLDSDGKTCIPYQ